MQPTKETVPAASLAHGMVVRKSLGQYDVDVEGRTVSCDISNVLRKELIYPTSAGCKHPRSDPAGCPRCRPLGGTIHRRVRDVAEIRVVDPVAIGDIVQFIPTEEDRGLIVEVLPRRNTLVRRAAGLKPLKQVVAANIDRLFAVVSAASPHPSWETVDRYLAAAEESEISACVIITKIDLVKSDLFASEIEAYRRMGYPTLLTSAATGEGIETLRDLLRNRVSVFAGRSGVGKTSLLNVLQSDLGLRVGAVSEHGPQAGKGKHTTSHVELFSLDFGGAIVDTPGMREFGLWDTSSKRQRQEHEEGDLAELFVDMREYVGLCRFGLDCSHSHEPGCAIKEAVEDGRIYPRRYWNYLRIKAGV